MNLLRERLWSRPYLLGGGVCLNDPQVSEALGQVYDFLWVDMEHTGMTCEVVREHLIAARAAGCAAVVRIPWNDPVLAKPVLDMGPAGVVFPQVGGLEDAKRAIDACRYPPRGYRGWGPIRALEYGLTDGGAYRAAESDLIFPILQVENLSFLRDLEQILQLEGLGAVCVGPCDLSASLGRLGDLHHRDVRALFDQIGAAAQAFGIPLMVSLGYDRDAAEVWALRGARLLQVGSDYSYMLAEARRQTETMREILAGGTNQ